MTYGKIADELIERSKDDRAMIVGSEIRAAIQDAYAAGRAAENEAWNEVLHDGHAVFCALDERAKIRTSPEAVSDTLDAFKRVLRQRMKE